MKYVVGSRVRKSLPVIQEAAVEAKKRTIEEKIPVSCKSGCNSCCSRPIVVSMVEAAVIQDYLVTINKWEEVRDRAKECEQFDDLDRQSWFRMKIKCPVLDPKTGLCTAYEVRPLECSIHYVTSIPANCDPWAMGRFSYKKVDFNDLFLKYASRLINIVGDSIFVAELPLYKGLLISDRLRRREIIDSESLIRVMATEKI